MLSIDAKRYICLSLAVHCHLIGTSAWIVCDIIASPLVPSHNHGRSDISCDISAMGQQPRVFYIFGKYTCMMIRVLLLAELLVLKSTEVWRMLWFQPRKYSSTDWDSARIKLSILHDSSVNTNMTTDRDTDSSAGTFPSERTQIGLRIHII